IFNPRPLLVFFSWLGAQPGPVAKYRDLYLQQGMDVLLVQSSVMHFLWPRWGIEYGLEVLRVLEEPPFIGRTLLVHASSIGGYTFTQILCHIAQEPERYATLRQRMTGHIYDSLVVGTLEHMALDLGPKFGRFADIYNSGIQIFYNTPITAPALFFYCENDALCDHLVIEKIIELWSKRGMVVQSMKWRESIHAAHLRVHPEDYLSTLARFKSIALAQQ
uniref:Si:dkey-5i3.5 n=1 Tax=Neogobius melanostomus TaxID=47308 RepID=A0A8C6U8B8_9GOBI